ncbi:MAG: uroporphyrinogen decarboxylase [Actinomycetota bacterium]|nr:uroporphyrinogen decarboxylase [Actinomycetota bacterium]
MAATSRVFLDACRGRPVPFTPVWFMRQAGRSLPEYRALRKEGSILEVVRRPELAAEITLQPVRRYGVDAAILYSDIVVPVASIGFGVDIVPGVGPVAERRFDSPADLGRLRCLEPDEDLPWVAETVRILVGELQVPLIGFAGAPFTVASYLVEGRPSRDYVRTKALMHSDQATWFALMDRLASIAVRSLAAQVAAGAAAVQVFDSWAGALDPDDYRRFVLPATKRVIGDLEGCGVPRILFGVGTGELLGAFAETGADVVGVDWRVPLEVARRRVGPGPALQGNLDPAVCAAGWDPTRAKARAILSGVGGAPGHVFNLGHGVLPETDPAVLGRLVELVHEQTTGGGTT